MFISSESVMQSRSVNNTLAWSQRVSIISPITTGIRGAGLTIPK
jgi:hypothetical protein